MATISDLYIQLFGKGAIKDGSVIDMAEHGRAGGVSTGQGFKVVKDVVEKTIIDEASATVTYVGTALVATGTDGALWQITRITESGTTTTIETADGDDNYDNVWDNRASLSYS